MTHADLERLLEHLYPEQRDRAPRAAAVLRRYVDGEPLGRLLAELVRASAPTLPPAADASPLPPTLPTGPKAPKGTDHG